MRTKILSMMALCAIAIGMSSCLVDKHGDAIVSWSVTSTGRVSTELNSILSIYDEVFTNASGVEQMGSGRYVIVRNTSSAPTALAKELAAKADKKVKEQVTLSKNSSYTAKVEVEWMDEKGLTAATYTYTGEQTPNHTAADIKELKAEYSFVCSGGLTDVMDFYIIYADIENGKIDSVLLTPGETKTLTIAGKKMLFGRGFNAIRKAGVDAITEEMDTHYSCNLQYDLTVEFTDGTTEKAKHEELVKDNLHVTNYTKINKQGMRYYYFYEMKWSDEEQAFVSDGDASNFL